MITPALDSRMAIRPTAVWPCSLLTALMTSKPCLAPERGGGGESKPNVAEEERESGAIRIRPAGATKEEENLFAALVPKMWRTAA